MGTEVEIELSKLNYHDYYYFDFISHIKKGKSLIILLLLIIGAMYFIINGIIFFAFIFLLSLLGIFIGFAVRVHRQCNDARLLIQNGLNKCKYIFDEDKFIEETRLKRNEYNSSAILNVDENNKYLFLYKYHRVAWIIPKNQLNENQYNEILEFFNKNNISVKNYS